MNLLVTLNKKYLNQLIVMLYSYLKNNKYYTNIYIMNNDLTEEDFNYIKKKLKTNNLIFYDIKVDKDEFIDAPTSKRYPTSIYYRLASYKYLPTGIEKVLYLDPDIIIRKDIKKLYDLDLKDNCFAAATHLNSKFFKKFNQLRLKLSNKSIYINSGVMLINIKELRNSNIELNDIYLYIEKNRYRLFLPDQDIITKFFEGRIYEIDSSFYNMTEKLLSKYDYEWVDKNTAIIHYCGRNKPWNDGYVGKLKKYYDHYQNKVFGDKKKKQLLKN